jgi:type I restriction enzyme S subunit
VREGWTAKSFEDCLDRVSYPSKVQRKNFQATGKFPVISQESDFINGYWDNEADVLRVDRPLVVFGDHTQVLKTSILISCSVLMVSNF